MTYFVCAHQGEAWSRKDFLIFISLSGEHSATAFNIIQNDTVGNHSCHVHILLFEMELNSTTQFCIWFSIKSVLLFKLKENKELQWVYSGGCSVKRCSQSVFQYICNITAQRKYWPKLLYPLKQTQLGMKTYEPE